MKSHREKLYLIPTIFGLLTFVAIWQLIASLATNSKNIEGLYVTISWSFAVTLALATSISAALLLFVIKPLDKRSKSALIMSVTTSWIGYTGFVTLNAYLKSGLSDKVRAISKDIIYRKNIDTILKDANVVKQLKIKTETAAEINNILILRTKSYISEDQANSYIFEELKSHGITFTWKTPREEIIEIGQYL